jgi:hypothetical protein
MEAPIRDPAITRVLDAAKNALCAADNPLAKLHALREAAAALEPFDDTGAIDDLSEAAINVYDVNPDDVQIALANGFERSGQLRVLRTHTRSAESERPPEPPPQRVEPKLEQAAPWWCDPSTIPPREFLYGRHYIRRAIGATIAAGGRGKTTLSVFEAVTMAVGRNLVTGEPLPDGPLRPWVANGEEDQDELDRRVAAVCQRYRVTQADLGGRLFVQSVRDRPMRIATIVNGQPVSSATTGSMSSWSTR